MLWQMKIKRFNNEKSALFSFFSVLFCVLGVSEYITPQRSKDSATSYKAVRDLNKVVQFSAGAPNFWFGSSAR